ncbi:FkbM family methyltransferase [Candidatus Pelagibacter sp.]|nr:FkbM family methyltransferase [Candidatus Pelagibacter sp.]
MIKSKFITKIFQNFVKDKDIRVFKRSFLYYVIFRIVRNFLENDIIINIYSFKIFGSIKKNNTSYFLLKKCEFGDNHEFDTILRFSKNEKVFLLDCGCNYGFYTFYVASLSEKNYVVSIEASKKTADKFLRNMDLNNLDNISFFNKAISSEDNVEVVLNESINDWESSLTHDNFDTSSKEKIKTCKIDTLIKPFELKNYTLFIKLDIEGNEMGALKGAHKTIKDFSPIIIIEFSKFIFDKKKNIDYLYDFLNNYEYQIYDTNKNEVQMNEVIFKINKLTKRHKTIGNYYLIKKNSKQLKIFKKND